MPRPVYNNVLFLCAEPDRYTAMRYALKLRSKASLINCASVDQALDEIYRLEEDPQHFIRLVIAAPSSGETSEPGWLNEAARRISGKPIVAWDKDCAWYLPPHPAGIERATTMSSLIDAYFRLRLVTNSALRAG